jgi:hypothetical protein
LKTFPEKLRLLFRNVGLLETFQLFLKTFSEGLRLFQGLRGFSNAFLMELRLVQSNVRQCLCGLYKSYCRGGFMVPFIAFHSNF